MNCSKCAVPMTPVARVECRTGDAQKYRCPRCGAIHYQQLTHGCDFPPPLAQTFKRLAALVC